MIVTIVVLLALVTFNVFVMSREQKEHFQRVESLLAEIRDAAAPHGSS